MTPSFTVRTIIGAARASKRALARLSCRHTALGREFVRPDQRRTSPIMDACGPYESPEQFVQPAVSHPEPPHLIQSGTGKCSCGWQRTCRCGHTWEQHAQSRLDMIECDFCECEDFVP